MKKQLLPILSALGAFSSTVAAQEATYVSSDGDEYFASENEHGGVMTSRYPKSRFVEMGAASHTIDGYEIIYFGRSCDAFTKAFGSGTWGRANGGFVVEFQNGARMAFPRQDLPWESLIHCRL